MYIEGEGMVSAGYENIGAHGALQLTGNGTLGLTKSFPIFGNANVYPSILLAFGVSPSSQLQVTAPSEVNVNTQRFGNFNAASNIALDYEQRVFFSATKYLRRFRITWIPRERMPIHFAWDDSPVQLGSLPSRSQKWRHLQTVFAS